MAAVVDVFREEGLACLGSFASGYGFWVADAPGEPLWWPSAEHYFQAGKFAEPELRERIRLAGSPGEAKALGRKLAPLRPDWDAAKRGRLRRALLYKLWTHAGPRATLLAVPDDSRIVNGNPVDAFFGIGPHGDGANVVGLELESLRAFFRAFPKRRQLRLTVASVGDPHAPFRTFLDVAGMEPSALAGAAAEAMQLAPEAIEDIQLVTEGGFERTAAAELGSAQDLEAFLERSDGDCDVEVALRDAAIVTLWNGTDDCHLGATDVRHLCPTLASLLRRLKGLMPLRRHEVFADGVSFVVDDDEDARAQLDEAGFLEVAARASENADVVVSATYRVPSEKQPPLLQRPSMDDIGPAQVILGVHTAFDESTLVDRIRGAVWGAALGDAVGLATEFMKKAEAARHYPDPTCLGPACRVQDRHRKRWEVGDWTDDTDQFVLLLDAALAGGGLLEPHAFAQGLKRWRQEGFPELGDRSGLGCGETTHAVLEHPAFDVAPHIAAETVWRESACSVAANGAIMRCAAGALCYFWDEEAVTYNTLSASSVTHADPRCAASCVTVATLLSRTLQGVDMSTVDKRRDEAIVAALSAAEHLQGGDRDELHRHADVAALAELNLAAGGIGYTYKALGAASWVFVHGEDFREAITAITMEAGDADSNAAVAGALLGARLGHSRLPGEWLGELPARQKAWMEEKVKGCLRLLGLSA